MPMHRIIEFYLEKWRAAPNRKPLLIRGARQVGKTHAVRTLGKSFTHYVEVNFEQMPMAEIFAKDLDPARIIKEISLVTGQRVIPGETLLFLDEIQLVPRAITALRYFYEEMPELHVVSAGSLLEFVLDSISMPVGRISFLYMYPLSFLEFLKALEQDLLIQEIIEHPPEMALSLPVHQQLLNHLGVYLAIGGMPEAVQAWVDRQEVSECAEIHRALVGSYRQDFEKYTKKFQLKYVELLFNQIPRYLGDKIQFHCLSDVYRKRELAPCLDLLTKAHVICKVMHTSGNGIPLGAEVNFEKFKAIFLDVALSQSVLGADLKAWLLQPNQALVNKGPLVEAMVGQELLAYQRPDKPPTLYYWHREARGSQAEVDYLMQWQEHIIPVEVKSGLGHTLKSLKLFLDLHPVSAYGVRFSLHPYSVYENVCSYPLYAVAGAFGEDKQALQSLVD